MDIKKLLLSGLLATNLVACGGGDSPSADTPVTIKFTVANLPATLPINMDATKEAGLQYQWLIIFDMNKDGIINNGDKTLGITITKTTLLTPDTLDVPVDLLVENGKGVIGIFTDGKQNDVYFVQTTAKVSGNTIVFHAPKDQLGTIGIFNSTIPVHFKTTSIDNVGNLHHDYYPAPDTFIDIPADGKFTDDADEVFMDEMQHIDLVAMEVLVN